MNLKETYELPTIKNLGKIQHITKANNGSLSDFTDITGDNNSDEILINRDKDLEAVVVNDRLYPVEKIGKTVETANGSVLDAYDSDGDAEPDLWSKRDSVDSESRDYQSDPTVWDSRDNF